MKVLTRFVYRSAMIGIVRSIVATAGLLACLVAASAPADAAVRFPPHSCWVRRPNPGSGPFRPIQVAPSVLAPAPRRPVDPAALLRTTLSRFGDDTIIHSAHLGQIPALLRKHRRGWFGPAPQPRNPLWLYVDAPALSQSGTQSPQQVVRGTREQWELSLLAGALRDEACEARTAPLVGASVAGPSAPEATVFMAEPPFGQHFANVTPQVLRLRATQVARAFHARLASMWFLHPLQLAPVIVFETSDKTAFIENFAHLEERLGLRGGAALRFEGYFIEAVDLHHVPFMLTWAIARGELAGGQWSSDRCHYPFATLGGNLGRKSGCNG